ncbi:hypothetical protein LguiA_007341 [Lonicera macranthoides]
MRAPIMACNDLAKVRIFIIILALLLIGPVSSKEDKLTDSEILIKFKENLDDNKGALSNWNNSKPPCSHAQQNWAGVLCNDNGTVWGLKLENMGLKGDIHVEALSEIHTLVTISLMNNSFEGPLPDLRKIGDITSIYLSHNKFSGDIPIRAFEGMVTLKKLHLADNQFTGPIPWSLAIIPRLAELHLEDNSFEGEIPEFTQKRLPRVNLSNNNLQGAIPFTLSKLNANSFLDVDFLKNSSSTPEIKRLNDKKTTVPGRKSSAPSIPSPLSSVMLPISSPSSSVIVDPKVVSEIAEASQISYRGNKYLCGRPLDPCASANKISIATIVVIVLVLGAAIAAIAAAMIILFRRRSRKVASVDIDKMEKASLPSSNGRKLDLTFLRDDRQRFDLADLLKASAEILGSGVFGASYKAAICVGPVMVVKRFRQMNNVGKEDFQEHMRRLGRLRHPNLLPLVAFYYRKEEKLLVSDYVDNVSLAVYLHGNRQPGLDWAARLKIVKGVVKGLLYLYNELPSLIVPHGHLKSSNVLLNESFEPLLTDYGLVPIINQEHAQELMVAYKSPEYKQTWRITKKTDVWSLGTLILEILTGKFPANSLHQGKIGDTDLATWAQSLVREDFTNMEVFDKDIRGTKNSEGEMMKLLKIGLSCCEIDVEKRLDMKEVAEKIEELREKDSER